MAVASATGALASNQGVSQVALSTTSESQGGFICNVRTHDGHGQSLLQSGCGHGKQTGQGHSFLQSGLGGGGGGGHLVGLYLYTVVVEV